MRLARLLVHAALLALPLVALGRTGQLVRGPALACLVAMLVFGEVELRARRTADPSRFGAPGTRLALGSALGLLATAWAACGFPSDHRAGAWPLLGAAAIALGVALRAMAIRTLGASFTSETVVMPGRPLVTHGIYAALRHPSECGLVLVAGGLALLGGSVLAGLVAALAVVPTVALRVIGEERVLARSLHEQRAEGVGGVKVRVLGARRAPREIEAR